MDAHLKALADISLALTSAEAFLDEAANFNAREDLDRAAEGLAALREQWPQMSAAERTVVGRTAGPLRDRLDAARARLPRLSALTVVAPEPGEEEDDDDPLGSGGPLPPSPDPPAAA
ncbi:MAG: hypothetical protein JWO02_2518 [Solirubrobacterales bacterium]|nr:hypothetical protein [Solirubrobacterales bacterium]